jgi:hypothetical protein
MHQSIAAPPPRRRRALFYLAIFALGVLALELRPLAPRPSSRPMVPYSAEAALAHYRKNPVHDRASLFARYDRSSDGVLDAAEAMADSGGYAAFYRDLSALLDPSERLDALDALSPDAARGLLYERAAPLLLELDAAPDPRDAYWRMDTVAQYLARRVHAITAAKLALIDGGGERRIHGGEDLPPVMAWSDASVRAFPVPWPPGNVAVAEVAGRTRVFLTPFPDGNFSDTQVHELDLASGALSAYPPGRADLQHALRTSLGIEAHRGFLYIVDHGGYGLRDARLVAIDLEHDRVVLDHPFATATGQMPNDLAFVDEDDRTRVFISDTAPARSPIGGFNAKSGIIEIDVRQTGDTLTVLRDQRWLDGHPLVEDGGWSMYPDRDRPARTWLGKLGWGGVDGIAARGHELYFRRMQQAEIMVAPANAITPENVRVLDRFPFIDGFHIDERGLLWFGDVEGSAIYVYDLTTRAMVKVLQDARFHWLDEVNVLGDQAYVTASHLHEYMDEVAPWRRKRAVAAAAPFFFYVIDLKPALATVERLRAELAVTR